MPFMLKKLKLTIESDFPGYWQTVEAALSVVMQLRTEDIIHPFTLIFIGQPSGSKTTVLNLFTGIPEITYLSDKFSPKGFVSHASNLPKKDLDKIDLLPRIRDKVLITPELAMLFRAEKQSLIENFSILTRVLDGSGLTIDSGVHGSRGYKGKYMFVWLGGTTPISPHIWQEFGNLGPRIYFYRMPEQEVSPQELVRQLSNERSYKEKLKNCSEIVRTFIQEQWHIKEKVAWDKSRDLPEAREQIAKLAILLSRLRGSVNLSRNAGGESAFNMPVIENPRRATDLLYNLARGRASLYGRNFIIPEDVELVRHVALSSAPGERTSTLKLLIENNGVLNTVQICKGLNCSVRIAYRIMKTFKMLGIVELETFGKEHISIMALENKFRWLIQDNGFLFGNPCERKD